MTLACQKALFTLPHDVHYLNCATFGPTCKSSEQAGISAIKLGRNPAERRRNLFFDPVEDARAQFGKLINASSDDIAVIPSASYGVATVAKNIELLPNEQVLVLENQFPSNYYTWQRKCESVGATLTIVPEPEQIDKSVEWTSRILDSIKPQTKVVTMGHVHWMDGTYFDLSAIGKRCREVGAYLIIDGTQSVGALPFDVAEIQPDALIVAGYKWLLGPYGLGYAYFGNRLLGGVPLEENWINRDRSDDFERLTEYTNLYRSGAARYSMGEQSNFISVAMSIEALKLLNGIGIQHIQNYTQNLSQPYWAQLKEAGIELTDKNHSHHMIGLRLDKHWDMDIVRDRLAQRNVVVSQRGNALRIAINVFNDNADLEILVQTILEERK